MQCVSTVEYRARFNVEESDSFKLASRLWQGYLLSPYLFSLWTQGLTTLLTHAEERGNILAVKHCRDAPPITNLIFADDSLIPMKENMHNVQTL